MTQKQKFVNACKEFVKQIDEIDKDASWAQTDTYWYQAMTKIRLLVQHVISTRGQG